LPKNKQEYLLPDHAEEVAPNAISVWPGKQARDLPNQFTESSVYRDALKCAKCVCFDLPHVVYGDFEAVGDIGEGVIIAAVQRKAESEYHTLL